MPRSQSLKWFFGTLMVLVLLMGLLLGAFRLAMNHAPEYRVQLQQWLNQRTGLVVEFRSLGARLRLYGPELVFDEAVVRTPDRTHVLATARRGSVGFDLWTAIRTGRLTAGRFALERPEIGLIRTREGRIQLVGQGALENSARPFALENLPTGRFRVSNAVVSFRDEITGRGPWPISGVNFELHRRASDMNVTGDASLPHSLGESLRFSARTTGALDQPQTLLSEFSVQGAGLDLAGWADVLPDAWPAPETGTGSIALSGEMRGTRLARFAFDVDVNKLAAVMPTWLTPLPAAALMQQSADDTPADAPPLQHASSSTQLLSYDRVAFSLIGESSGEGVWQLTASNVDLSRKDSPWRADAIQVAWRQRGVLTELSATADRVVLENVWPLLAYVPERSAVAHLRALQATGILEGAVLELKRDDESAPWRYSAQGRFDRVGFAPVARMPGLSGLSGELRATHERGEIAFDASDVEFDLPSQFRAPLAVREFDGVLAWRNSGQGWRIEASKLRLASEDGSAQAQLALDLPADGSSPVLELTAHAQDLNAASARKYMPAGKLSPQTLQWLDRAFIAGRVPVAELRYAGPTRQFPFRKGEGEFVVRGRAEGMTFDYQQGWMPATELAADLEFRNQGMKVNGARGRIGELTITTAAATFGDFKRGDLSIRAQAEGGLQNALQFLRASPIGPSLGKHFNELRAEGRTTAAVQLVLPLKHLAQRRIEVDARLADATVSLSQIPAPATRVNGSLAVRQSTVAAADLQGQWLGGPLHLMVQPSAAVDGNPRTELIASGRAHATQLVAALGIPAAAKLSGATQWRVTAALPAVARQGRQWVADDIRIDADLDGLGVGLPAPLGKQPQGARPLRIDLQRAEPQALLARVALDEVRGLLRLVQSKEGAWRLDRGALRADGAAASLPNHAGLRIEGEVARFVLDDWLALRSESGSGASPGRPLSDFLQAANVRVGALEAFGYRWSDVRGILQAVPGGWRVDVEGADAAGHLSIPQNLTGSAPLVLRLDRLTLIKQARFADSSAQQSDPRKLPNLSAHIGHLQLGQQTIGAVELKMSRIAQGVAIDELNIASDSVRATARGSWIETPSGQQSSLNAQIVSTDIAATLRALNYTQVMDAKRGEVRANLTWPGGFDAGFISRASGTLAVDAENGQLLSLQPGAGRMLGLFSVAALPRRLALDFSDLTEKGLSFDTIHGDFELRNGDAFTTNLLLRGPAAEIGIAGRTGLRAHDYDQTAIVTGNLGASLPVAGALAGGPVVGAAVLLFSQVFKEPLKGITRGYYRITGPWDEPVVERVDAAQVKEAASERSDKQRERG